MTYIIIQVNRIECLLTIRPNHSASCRECPTGRYPEHWIMKKKKKNLITLALNKKLVGYE